MNNKDGCEKHPHMDMDEHCECRTIIINIISFIKSDKCTLLSIKCFVNILEFELFVRTTMVTIEVYLKIKLVIFIYQ